jgi:dihydrofolate reductase
MPKTQYYTASSLDGFIADARHSLDWLLQFETIEGHTYDEFIRDVGAITRGSTTYEWILRQPNAPWPYEQPAWVFTTRTLPTVGGGNVRFVSGDVRAAHQQMRAAAGDKNIWIAGGGELAGQFYDHGLLDEIIVQFAPVTLGRDGGSPLFPRAVASPGLEMTSVHQMGSGFVEVRYRLPNARSRER